MSDAGYVDAWIGTSVCFFTSEGTETARQSLSNNLLKSFCSPFINFDSLLYTNAVDGYWLHYLQELVNTDIGTGHVHANRRTTPLQLLLVPVP
jgi:hypothetical protein